MDRTDLTGRVALVTGGSSGLGRVRMAAAHAICGASRRSMRESFSSMPAAAF